MLQIEDSVDINFFPLHFATYRVIYVMPRLGGKYSQQQQQQQQQKY